MQVVEAHGARIPTIGFGTMTLKGDVCVQAVKTALQRGYRHIDTAWFYGNEKEVGEGLRQSGVKREEIFLCTKVRETHLEPDKFRQSLGESLANLQLPYVDLLLIHVGNQAGIIAAVPKHMLMRVDDHRSQTNTLIRIPHLAKSNTAMLLLRQSRGFGDGDGLNHFRERDW